MKQKFKDSSELIEALSQAGYDPRSYSGRGMFGKYCVAISGSGISAWDVARNIDPDMWVPKPSQDVLGLGIVLYWPTYVWPKEENG